MKQILAIVGICCVGILAFAAIGGMLSPDQTIDSSNSLSSNESIDNEATTNTTSDRSNDDDSNDVDNSDSSSDTSSENGGHYVGSINSDKFHYPGCGQASKIKSYNLISFSSRADAINSGYDPCSFCNP